MGLAGARGLLAVPVRGRRARLLVPVIAAAVVAACVSAATSARGGRPETAPAGPPARVSPAASYPGPGSLAAVSCVGVSGCMAVGGAFQALAGNSGTRRIADWWNGKAWQVLRPAGSRSAPLSGVSCVSARTPRPHPECMMVGATALTARGRAVAELWTGRGWRQLSPPSPSPGSRVGLDGVSCVNLRSCVAVGFYDVRGRSRYLMEGWNGRGWRRLAVPTPAGNAYGGLSGVSCVKPAFCLVVGNYDNGRGTLTAVNGVWNGTAWRRLPNRGLGGSSGLSGVTCLRATRCMAVGATPAAAQWDGNSWTVTSPSRAGSALSSVACPRPDACVAVGNGDVNNYGQVLAEHWNGKAWRVMGSAGSDAGYSWFTGVSCPQVRGCMAVGATQDGSDAPDIPLSEWWNGRKWRLVPTP